MTICDKYPKLKDRTYIKKMILEAVFSSMALEGQTVNKAELEAYAEQQFSEDLTSQQDSGR